MRTGYERKSYDKTVLGWYGSVKKCTLNTDILYIPSTCHSVGNDETHWVYGFHRIVELNVFLGILLSVSLSYQASLVAGRLLV